MLLKYPDITWNRSNCINPISCMARSPNRCVSSVLVLFRYLSRRLLVVVVYIMWSNGKKGRLLKTTAVSVSATTAVEWKLMCWIFYGGATSFNGQHKHKKKKRRETKQKRPFFLTPLLPFVRRRPSYKEEKSPSFMHCIYKCEYLSIYIVGGGAIEWATWWIEAPPRRGRPNHFFYHFLRKTFSFIQSRAVAIHKCRVCWKGNRLPEYRSCLVFVLIVLEKMRGVGESKWEMKGL